MPKFERKSQRRSPSGSVGPDRRSVVLAGTALVGMSALPRFSTAGDAGLAPAADVLAGTRTFLASLEPEQRKAASFAWDGREWRGWNYFGSTGNIKPGLRLEQMSAAQKAAAWDLLATLFSPTGREKARNVMTLQDVLAARGDSPGERSSERFSFAVFGTPAETGTWGLRLEGSISPNPSPCATVASSRSRPRRFRPIPTVSRRDRTPD